VIVFASKKVRLQMFSERLQILVEAECCLDNAPSTKGTAFMHFIKSTLAWFSERL